MAADPSPPICLQMVEAGASTKLSGGHHCLKRHGLGVGAAQQTVLMEAPLQTTDARREEERGQGRVCLSLCGCVGQCPAVSLGAPSHVFVRMASVQHSGLGKQPSSQATRSQLHRQLPPHICTLPTLTHKYLTHLHIHITLYPHTHAAPPQGPIPSHMYTHYTHPTLRNQVQSHMCHIYMHPHTHS